MKDKKICLIIASPLTISFFHLGQITELAKRYDLTVITDTEDPNFLAHLGVRLTVIPVAIKRNVDIWKDLTALVRLAQIFFRERFDLVHTLSPKSGLLGMLAAWFARVPVRIHTFQGEVWVTRKGLWRTFLKNMDKVIARLATNLLVVSFSEKEFLVGQRIISQDKAQILANGSICGVDTARFRPSNSVRQEVRTALDIPQAAMVILYLGRLKIDKGLLDLADAFSRISQDYEGAHLLVVGPDEENVREQIRLKVDLNQTRLHFVDYTDAPERYLAASDILCLPSYREGFGLVLIEAAATGLPAIGSRIYGITDAIVEFETGLLFEPGNVDELAGNLKLLFEDGDLRKRLGERGRVRALEDFSKELVQSELFKYYDQRLVSPVRSSEK